MKHTQILGLDALRFGAATLVLLFHLSFWIAAPIENTAKRVSHGAFRHGAALFDFGWIGVQIFFVLSGFVIAWSASSASARVFVQSRLVRLAPGAWICATVTFGVVLIISAHSVGDALLRWLRSIAFWPSGPWIDGVYWTLGVEISFYALVFVLLWAQRRHWIEPACALLTLASTGFWLAYVLLPSASLQVFARSRVAELSLLRYGCEFGLGVAIWLLLLDRVSGRRLLMAGVALLGSLLEIVAAANALATQLQRPSSPYVPVSVWLVAVGLMVASVRWNAALVERWGAHSSTIRLLGLATYPLYLVHQLVGSALMYGLSRCGLPELGCLLSTIAAVMLLALLIAKVLEPPLQGWLRRQLRRLEASYDRLFAPAQGEAGAPSE